MSLKKLKDKRFVISMTKMATTHTREILHTLYPTKRVATFNVVEKKITKRGQIIGRVDERFDLNHTYWARKHEAPNQEADPESQFEYFGYAMRLRLNDTTFLDEADIFVESADDEVLWGDHVLSHLNPETTLVLNRNLRDWLISQFIFFSTWETNYSYTALLHKFFHKNQFYSRLSQYEFETINVTTQCLDTKVREFYTKGQPLPDNITDSLYELSMNPTHRSARTKKYKELRSIAEPFVDQLIRSLKITEEEQNLPFIPRLL